MSGIRTHNFSSGRNWLYTYQSIRSRLRRLKRLEYTFERLSIFFHGILYFSSNSSLGSTLFTDWSVNFLSWYMSNKRKESYTKKSWRTKGTIRSLKSKDGQYNGKMNKSKRTNNYLQNSPQKIEDWATRTPLKTGGVPEGLAVHAPLMTPFVRPLNDKNINNTWIPTNRVKDELNIGFTRKLHRTSQHEREKIKTCHLRTLATRAPLRHVKRLV